MAQRVGRSSQIQFGNLPFNLSSIRSAVPKHCFQRNLLISVSYLLYDITAITALALATKYLDSEAVKGIWFITWPIYWFVQGCFMTGLWIIGHECGHHAFSDFQWLDDSVGAVIHSALLVPYFSWKYTHSRHHSKCANLDGDTAFVPRLSHQLNWMDDTIYQHPFGRLLWIIGSLTVGWPMYLIANAMGKDYGRFACHFDPNAPFFTDKERIWVCVSDVLLLLSLLILYKMGSEIGFLKLFAIYGIPLHIVNAFLVTITYLQHTHPQAPHFSDSGWDWLKGTLTTVDRDYGFLNHVFHHITDTHVAHHLFPTMPFYRAKEATMAIKPVLGDFYRFDSTPILLALWREARECNYVELDGSRAEGAHWFKRNVKH